MLFKIYLCIYLFKKISIVTVFVSIKQIIIERNLVKKKLVKKFFKSLEPVIMKTFFFLIPEQAHWSTSRKSHLAPPTVLRWRRCVLLKWKWRRYQAYLWTRPFPPQHSSTPSSRRVSPSLPRPCLPTTRSV